MLQVIDGAPQDERVELVRHVLISFGLAMNLPNQSVDSWCLPPARRMDDQTFDMIHAVVMAPTIMLMRRVMVADLPSQTVAEAVWDHLMKLTKADERIVSFALILYSSLTPYAQITDDLVASRFGDMVPAEVFRRPNVLESRATVQRLLNYEMMRRGVSIGQMSEALLRVLDRHHDPVERLAVFQQIEQVLLELGVNSGQFQGQMHGLTRALQMVLGFHGELPDCGDPTCKGHPKQRAVDQDEKDVEEKREDGSNPSKSTVN
ncbi:hypothetical protein HY628_01510 [Candidatus Uhrbacteria bacterium]|nr:hypothetical protein [Candidatus Uhrbacteria bacterium]